MTEPSDTRPRTVIPIQRIETLAMALDFAFAAALDPGNGLSMELPPERIDKMFPGWRQASPQEMSMMTAMIVIEWLSGHKVVVRGSIDKGSRPRKPPTAQAHDGKQKPPGYDEAMAEARTKKIKVLRVCGHCGLEGLKGKPGKCVWCGEKQEKA